MTVSRDALIGWYVPASSAEWTELLAGSGIAVPISLWLCQEAAGNLIDSITGNSLVASGSPTYQQAIANWTRKAVKCADGTSQNFIDATGTNSNSCLAFAYVAFPANVPATERTIMAIGSAFASNIEGNLKPSSNPTLMRLSEHGGGGTHTDGVQSVASAVHPVLVQGNVATTSAIVQTDLETITKSPYTAGILPGNRLWLGGDNVQTFLSGGASYLYVARWNGANAELDAAHRATLLGRLQNGPPASSGYSRGRSVNDGRMNAFSRGKVVN